jgi:hypothetical protein
MLSSSSQLIHRWLSPGPDSCTSCHRDGSTRVSPHNRVARILTFDSDPVPPIPPAEKSPSVVPIKRKIAVPDDDLDIPIDRKKRRREREAAAGDASGQLRRARQQNKERVCQI